MREQTFNHPYSEGSSGKYAFERLDKYHKMAEDKYISAGDRSLSKLYKYPRLQMSDREGFQMSDREKI